VDSAVFFKILILRILLGLKLLEKVFRKILLGKSIWKKGCSLPDVVL
jgi:hypothetical protein